MRFVFCCIAAFAAPTAPVNEYDLEISQAAADIQVLEVGATSGTVFAKWKEISGKPNPTNEELIALAKSKIVRAQQSKDWEPLFRASSFLTSKRPIPIKFEVTSGEGKIMALEGFQKYKQGQVLITGIEGEQYVVSSEEKFNKLYQIIEEGTAVPKFSTRQALVATKPGKIETSWSVLEITPGDVVTRIGPGDYTVVKKNIFDQTFMGDAGSEAQLRNAYEGMKMSGDVLKKHMDSILQKKSLRDRVILEALPAQIAKAQYALVVELPYTPEQVKELKQNLENLQSLVPIYEARVRQ